MVTVSGTTSMPKRAARSAGICEFESDADADHAATSRSLGDHRRPRSAENL
jgi:hypothetical protein